jgi:hypothetical protein
MDVFAIQLLSNQVSRSWEFDQSDDFDVPLSSNQVFWEPEDQAIKWKDRRKSRMFSEATSARFGYIRNFNITLIFQRDCKINLY